MNSFESLKKIEEKKAGLVDRIRQNAPEPTEPLRFDGSLCPDRIPL